MEDEEARTIWCGNLSEKVTEELLYELFLQAAPLEDVRIPTDRNGRKANYAFIVVKHAVSVDYVTQLLNGTCLYDRTITVKPRNSNRNNSPVGVNFSVELKKTQRQRSPTFHPSFHNERNYGKPYYAENRSGRQNWNNRRNNHNNRRRFH